MRRKIVPDIIAANQPFITVSPDMTVRAAAELMTLRKVGALLVAVDGRLVGILSERDVVGRVVAKSLDVDTLRVGQVMTPDPVCVRPDDQAVTALDLMQRKGFRHLPVLDGTTICGILSIRDLYHAVHASLEEEVKQRDAFMFGGGYAINS